VHCYDWWEEDLDKREDLQTMLGVHHVFFNGTSAADKLLVGSYFRLNVTGTNVTSGFGTDYNRTVTGIVHRRRLCDRGEYISASQYCEECLPFQFSNIRFPHEQRHCTPATEAAIAPGGAVLVPVSGGKARTSGLGRASGSFAACIAPSGFRDDYKFLRAQPLAAQPGCPQHKTPCPTCTAQHACCLCFACSLAWH
jgi:hypothetical protein